MKRKSKFKEIVLEIVLEIALTAVCFGVGALIFRAFGIRWEALFELDPELVVLVGIIVPLAIFALIYFVVQAIKKKNKK